NDAFLKDFSRLQTKLAYFGVLSSLSQTVLKITSPGVPDLYRGNELWEFSLADPDNRRPVDFSFRVAALEKLREETSPSDLLKHCSDGRLKLYLNWKLLNFRREHADLFLHGEYIPIHVSGPLADHVIAFARRVHGDLCIIAVPRLCGSLTRAGFPP